MALPSKHSKMTQTIIEDRYIDEEKLLDLCRARFGAGNYRLRWTLNKWYLSAPGPIEDDELDRCELKF
ncbi:hypothetical protein BCR34DRAFT_600818 [Clohesyomyces aquaticus]|uniref:Uncharacterized protein n=1 Tax=Clohesyomyces aquaticus TaxID=1231657 RepID=A0A1Y1ZPY9_9PLEO|nr:hypothetical protein BCR34DRAFT_600818 [Clohesyomyces aquaticus]